MSLLIFFSSSIFSAFCDCNSPVCFVFYLSIRYSVSVSILFCSILLCFLSLLLSVSGVLWCLFFDGSWGLDFE